MFYLSLRNEIIKSFWSNFHLKALRLAQKNVSVFLIESLSSRRGTGIAKAKQLHSLLIKYLGVNMKMAENHEGASAGWLFSHVRLLLMWPSIPSCITEL